MAITEAKVRKGKTGLPVYHQLYIVLRSQILDGLLQPGDALPTEPELASHYSVSRVSVRHALGMLEKEGRIIRRRGSGTFVKETQASPEAPIGGVIENLITIGLDTQAKTLRFETRSAPVYAAKALGVETGASCLYIERLRSHKGASVSYTTLWVPPAYAADIKEAELGDLPVLAVLEKHGHPAQTAVQSLSAISADDRAAQLLNTGIGSPLIRLHRTVHAADNTPLLFQRSLYAPERYEYQMTLSRDMSAAQPRWQHVG